MMADNAVWRLCMYSCCYSVRVSWCIYCFIYLFIVLFIDFKGWERARTEYISLHFIVHRTFKCTWQINLNTLVQNPSYMLNWIKYCIISIVFMLMKPVSDLLSSVWNYLHSLYFSTQIFSVLLDFISHLGLHMVKKKNFSAFDFFSPYLCRDSCAGHRRTPWTNRYLSPRSAKEKRHSCGSAGHGKVSSVLQSAYAVPGSMRDFNKDTTSLTHLFLSFFFISAVLQPNACATFNFLTSERRVAAAGLIPPPVSTALDLTQG